VFNCRNRVELHYYGIVPPEAQLGTQRSSLCLCGKSSLADCSSP